MAEDWGKWQKEWDKLEPKARKLSLAQGEKLLAALRARDKLLEKHEKDFRAALKLAVEAGATGTEYKAFEGKKGVAPAKAALDEDCRQVQNEINEVNLYSKECDALAKPIDKLTDAMAKAIKSTKEKSPEREKAKKLFTEIQTKLKDLHEASHLHYKVDKFLIELPKQFPAWIKHLIAEEVKGGKGAAEKTAAKEASVKGIDEKSLKAAEDEADTLHEALREPLVEAHGLLGGQVSADVLKKAAGLVKDGQSALIKLNKFATQVKDLYAKNKKAIDGAKTAKALQGHIAAVAQPAKEGAAEFKMVGEDLKAAMKKK
jgi:hypothetical protein